MRSGKKRKLHVLADLLLHHCPLRGRAARLHHEVKRAAEHGLADTVQPAVGARLKLLGAFDGEAVRRVFLRPSSDLVPVDNLHSI